ncbi:hypothetical protein AO442_002908, partial [Nakaseomyces glabratus]
MFSRILLFFASYVLVKAQQTITTPTTLTGNQNFNEDIDVQSSLTLNDGSEYIFNNLLDISLDTASVEANAQSGSVFTFSMPPSSSFSNLGTLTINNNAGVVSEQHININPSTFSNSGTLTIRVVHYQSDSSSTMLIDSPSFANSGTINYERTGTEINDPGLEGNILHIGSAGHALDNTGIINLAAGNNYYLQGNIQGEGGSINVNYGLLHIDSTSFAGNTINLGPEGALAMMRPVPETVVVRGFAAPNFIASAGTNGAFAYNEQTGILTVTTDGNTYTYDIGCGYDPALLIGTQSSIGYEGNL